MKGLFLILICVLINFSCSNDNCKYPYRENLDKFLADELNYRIPEDETILVFLPLDACSSCLESTIKTLVDNKKSSHIDIIVSTSNRKSMKRFGIQNLNSPNYKIYFDKQNKYLEYELGVLAPMIFHFRNRDCQFHSETTSANLMKIKKHFGWL